MDESTTTIRYRGTVLILVVHGLLLSVDLSLALIVVPRFAAMFADFGVALPSATRAVLVVSHLMRSHAVFVLYSSASALVGDAVVHIWLTALGKTSLRRIWSWSVSVLLILLGACMTLAMFLPMGTISQAVEG
jgi:hypothetical protein